MLITITPICLIPQLLKDLTIQFIIFEHLLSRSCSFTISKNFQTEVFYETISASVNDYR